MDVAEFLVGFIELAFSGCVLLIYYVEQGRFPGTRLKWEPFVHGERGDIAIGVRRKSQRVTIKTLSGQEDKFDELLIAAESEAREKCVLLNVTQKHLQRRLP